MSLSETEVKRRRAYGRGLYQGLLVAGVNDPGEFMNATRLTRIESGLNGLAKKVLDVVPLTEAWTKDQITSELYREGQHIAPNILLGALGRMREQGLVREPTPGSFIRVQARVHTRSCAKDEESESVTTTVQPIRPPAPAAPEAAPPPKDAPKGDVFTRLAQIAVVLRSVADEAEAIALEAEERMQELKRDTDKLRQLQALLKSIGGSP